MPLSGSLPVCNQVKAVLNNKQERGILNFLSLRYSLAASYLAQQFRGVKVMSRPCCFLMK